MRRPKRKKHRVLKAILITIAVIIISIPVAVFSCFYVKEDIRENPIPDFNLEQWTSGLASRAFDDTKDDGLLKIGASEDEINAIIFENIANIPDIAKPFVPGAYITIEDDCYVFTVNLRAYFFDSVIKIKTQFSLIEDETNPFNNVIEFKIIDYKVGRIGGLSWLASMIYKNMDLQTTIENALNEAGFSMTVDLEHHSISYKIADAIEDILTITGSSDLNIQYYLMMELLEQGIIDIDFYNEKSLTFIADLNALGHAGLDEKYLNLDIHNEVKAKIETLIDSGNVDKEVAADLFQFFFHGYDKITSERKAVIQTVDFSALSPTFDYESYEGFSSQFHGVPIDEVVRSQIEGNPDAIAHLLNDEVFAEIRESDIDNFLRGEGNILGLSTILDRQEDDGYICNFITLSDIYTNVTDGGLSFYMVMSFCGYPVDIILNSTQVESDSRYEISYRLDSIQIEEFALIGELGDQLLQYLSEGLQGVGVVDYVLPVSETDNYGYFVFDFEDSLPSDYKTVIESLNKRLVITHVDSPDGDGRIQLAGTNA